MRLPGPHFPILSRRLGRKHLSPDPFSKKMAQVPKPAKTSEIFLAHGHDLTFPSRVQSLVEKICCHTDFGKNERRRHSLSAHVHFFQPLARTSLFHIEFQAWAGSFVPTPISGKTNTWSATRVEQSIFLVYKTRASFSRLVTKTWPRAVVFTPIPRKNDRGAEACRAMWDFFNPLQWPHFRFLCPRFVRTKLLPHTLLKKPMPAQHLARTCSICIARGRNLTFPSSAPSLAENCCPHHHFWKN